MNGRLVDSANPVRPGDVLLIFCTGLGPVTNQPESGAAPRDGVLAMSATEPVVMLGRVRDTVLFAGLAPGFVGLYQVNAQVPDAGVASGAASLSVSIGGFPSNIVRIPVQ